MKLLLKTLLIGPLTITLLTGCNPKLAKDEATIHEAQSVKADLKLEMLAPPTSKKLADKLISPLEIGQINVRGSNTGGLGEMISDKINASINETGYVQVVTNGGAAKLTGTLTISELEKGVGTKSLLQSSLEDGSDDSAEANNDSSSGLGISNGTLNAVGSGVLTGLGALGGFGGATDAITNPTMGESAKRISGTLVYKITDTNGQVLVSGNLEHELTEKQTSLLLSKGMQANGDNLTSDSRITNKLLDIIADKVAEEVSPHTHVFLFNWMAEGCSGDESFNSAIKYAKQGLDSEAEDKWKALSITAKDSKCRSAALYNHGLLKLRADQNSKINQKEAYDMFVEADALNPGNKEITTGIKKLKKIAFTNFTPVNVSKNVVMGGQYRLFVNTKPKNCEVTLLEADSETDYEPAMQLKPGDYKLKISSGRKSKIKKFTIKDRDVTLNVKL